jgi:hypothetical protein
MSKIRNFFPKVQSPFFHALTGIRTPVIILDEYPLSSSNNLGSADDCLVELS